MPALASRAIRLIRYDADRRRLFVTFRDSGKTYAYFDVPPQVYGAFLAAESHGSFFSEHVRDAFRFEEVPDRPR
ncbi:MAG: KTSC domain-containing protein [Gemmatimonas sp.]